MMMVVRWHINKKGEPGKCTAKIRCDFANADGQEPPHFTTQKEAREAVEKALEQLVVPASLKRTEDEIPKWKQDRIRRSNVPLTCKKFEILEKKQNSLIEAQRGTAAIFSKTTKDINEHNDYYGYSDSPVAMAIYKKFQDNFKNAQIENVKSKQALATFNDINGSKMDEFRANNLSREDYGKLYAERAQLSWDVEAAQNRVRIADAALSEDDYYSSKNDTLDLDSRDALMRDFEEASDELDEQFTKMKKFREDNEEKMDIHVKEFGEWNRQDELLNGKRESPDMDLDY